VDDACARDASIRFGINISIFPTRRDTYSRAYFNCSTTGTNVPVGLILRGIRGGRERGRSEREDGMMGRRGGQERGRK